MAEISRYGKTVLALTMGFALFCGGWFAARCSDAQSYPVTAQRRPVLEEEAAPPEEPEEGTRPDSLLPGEVIDINTADIYDLQRLPGIGEKRAADIIAYRTEHGPFRTVDELANVSGIGPVIVEDLREYAAAGNE